MIATTKPISALIRHQSYLVLGKVLIVIAAGIWAGSALTRSNQSDFAQGHSLTREKYEAGYDTYRAKLMKDSDDLSVNAPLMVIVLAGMFALYEVGGVARVIEFVVARRANRGTSDADESHPVP